MSRTEILEAIRAYLSLLEPVPRAEDREGALRRALDGLAWAYHFAVPDPGPRDGQPASPQTNDRSLRARAEAAFPALGLYNVALEAEQDVGTSELGVGDAIDDIVDIAADLTEVLNRWEKDENDALFHFRLLFEAHWGKHLRELQLYLHARAF